MNNFKIKKSYNFSNLISLHFQTHKTYLIGFCGVFLLGLVVGIFSYVKFNSTFDFASWGQDITINLFVSNVGVFGFMFRMFFTFLLNSVIILLLCLTIYLCPATFLFVSYLGYGFGADIVVIINVLGAGGLLCLILFFIPFSLAIFFLQLNFACICKKHCVDGFKFGKYYKNCAELGFNLKTFLIILGIVLVLCFFQSLFLPQSIKNILISF